MAHNQTPLSLVSHECLIGEILSNKIKSGWDEWFLFWDKYKRYPSELSIFCDQISYMHYDDLLVILKNEYNHDIEEDIFRYGYSSEDNKMFVDKHLVDLKNGVLVNFTFGYMQSPEERSESADEKKEKFEILTGK
jgi:hypothetical protein